MKPFAAGRRHLLAAHEIADAVRSGRISAVSIIYEHHRRAAALAHLRALVSPGWERARSRAAEINRRITAGEPVGALAGVPFTVKDVIAVAGFPAAIGSRALRDNRPVYEATAVSRLLAEDAIVVGKTNCPEFAFGTTGWMFGAVINEYHRTA
jgi:amidase